MDAALFERNGLKKLGGVLHLGAHRCEEMDFYSARNAEWIMWVEANPAMWKTIRQRLQEYKGPMRQYLLAAAISDQDGKTTLERHEGSEWDSLLPVRGGRGGPIKDTIKVKARTLDAIYPELLATCGPCNLLVMDVQGAELLALRGGETFLKQRPLTHIYTEVCWEKYYDGQATEEELKAFLEPFGFKLVDLDYEGGAEWGNLLFARDRWQQPAAGNAGAVTCKSSAAGELGKAA